MWPPVRASSSGSRSEGGLLKWQKGVSSGTPITSFLYAIISFLFGFQEAGIGSVEGYYAVRSVISFVAGIIVWIACITCFMKGDTYGMTILGIIGGYFLTLGMYRLIEDFGLFGIIVDRTPWAALSLFFLLWLYVTSFFLPMSFRVGGLALICFLLGTMQRLLACVSCFLRAIGHNPVALDRVSGYAGIFYGVSYFFIGLTDIYNLPSLKNIAVWLRALFL